jgi:hypothetical protein
MTCEQNIRLRARRSFQTKLIRLQLDEASFLYDQRRYLLNHDQLSWVDVKQNEKRFLKHLWALEQLSEGRGIDIEELIEDAGALHTAVCLFCRQGHFDRLGRLIEKVDWTNDDVFWAAADGLKWEAPDTWRNRLVRVFSRHKTRGIDLLSLVFGYRRWSLRPIFQLLDNGLPMSRALIRAVGRSGGAEGIDRLKEVILSDDDSLKTDASIALLRWGSFDHVKDVHPYSDPNHWAWLPLGLLGRSGIQERLESLVDTAPSAETLLTLGLLGRPSAVERIIPHTAHEELGKYASSALQLITGRNLFETVFIPDKIDLDVLTEEEQARFHQGEPVYGEGKTPGDTVERISKDPCQWQRFWDENRFRFNPKIPYRLGKPYSPIAPLNTLLSPHFASFVRALAYEETVIRHGVNLVFETDFLVEEQQRILSTFKQRRDDREETAVRCTGVGRF